jgi:hypothetical protein
MAMLYKKSLSGSGGALGRGHARGGRGGGGVGGRPPPVVVVVALVVAVVVGGRALRAPAALEAARGVGKGVLDARQARAEPLQIHAHPPRLRRLWLPRR